MLTVIVRPIEIKCHRPGQSDIVFGAPRRISRFIGTLLEFSRLNFGLWQNIVKFALLSNLPHSSNSPLCWYPCLNLSRLHFGIGRNIVKFAIFSKLAAFVESVINTNYL